jgi:glycosyltransferase involved in cell wall biosynthesis
VRIIHLSYVNPQPKYNDPEQWLARISFITGVFEAEARHAEVIAIYHIDCKTQINRRGVRYYFTALRRRQLMTPFSFHRFVRSIEPDAIIVHGLIFPLQVILLRWQMRAHVKLILQHHAERPFSDFRKYIQRFADRYVFAYLFAARELGHLWFEKKQIKDPQKIREVMGTSSDFEPIPRVVAREMTKVVDGKIYLWVGGLDSNKDPMTAASAFSEFSKGHTDVHLYMIYQTFELLDELEKFKTEHDRTDRIHLIGRVEHTKLQFWYNAADFIISSSHYEGSGIAVCEAMSCGCIPILTEIPSFRMMTNNKTIGWLYPAGDAIGLKRVLEESLRIDITLRRTQVLRFFQEELSFEANARKIRDIIQGK